jgi:hypothetical protein
MKIILLQNPSTKKYTVVSGTDEKVNAFIEKLTTTIKECHEKFEALSLVHECRPAQVGDTTEGYWKLVDDSRKALHDEYQAYLSEDEFRRVAIESYVVPVEDVIVKIIA